MWKYACIGVLVSKIVKQCRSVQSLVSKINNFAIWQKKTWYVHVITFYLTEKSHLITFWIIFTQANNDLPIMTCAYTCVCYHILSTGHYFTIKINTEWKMILLFGKAVGNEWHVYTRDVRLHRIRSSIIRTVEEDALPNWVQSSQRSLFCTNAVALLCGPNSFSLKKKYVTIYEIRKYVTPRISD